MKTTEPQIHSFIIKLWVEPGGRGTRAWHGYITHVQDNERRYLQKQQDILTFIQPYLPKRNCFRSWRRWG